MAAKKPTEPIPMRKTRGQLEAEISEALTRFEKEFMGRGPTEAKSYILDDVVLVRLKGILTQAEYHLTRSEDPARGRDLVKQMRLELLERGRPMLEAIIRQLLGRKVVSLHTDLSTVTGERIIVFTLDGRVDF